MRKPQIQFLSFPGCPNAPGARVILENALERLGLTGQYEDVDILADSTPSTLRNWGSPTILVDGHDVAGGTARAGATCRIYEEGSHPTDAMVTSAIEQAFDGSD